LIEGLPQKNARDAESLFRNRLRQQIADKILLEPTGSKRMQLLETCGNIISQKPHSNRGKGELFTLFRQGDFQQRFPEQIKTISPEKNSKFIKGTTNQADDHIEIITNVGENSPPAGKYLVEDKFGADAFSTDSQPQARRYSDALKKEGGKVTAKDGKQYDGIIYFCSNPDVANQVLSFLKQNELNDKIYIGFYDTKMVN